MKPLFFASSRRTFTPYPYLFSSYIIIAQARVAPVSSNTVPFLLRHSGEALGTL